MKLNSAKELQKSVFEERSKHLVIYLGISQDRYDAGVALTDGHSVLYSANEERFTRKKSQGGFPYQSLQAAFAETGIEPEEVGRICFAGIMTPSLPVRAFPVLFNWFFQEDRTGKSVVCDAFVDFITFHTPLAHTSPNSLLRRCCRLALRPAVWRTLPKSLRKQPIRFVEHHHAHAACAFSGSGFENALCITADGMGDGLSMTVNRCNADGIERLWAASSWNSFGLFFEFLTESFGFIPCRHEGKIMGLAAHGDADRVQEPSPFRLEDGRLVYSGPYGRKGVAWAKTRLHARYSREDIAAWMQRILEENVQQIARHWLQVTGLDKLVAAGGIFNNVKLNQRLHELDGVDELFISPNMGDGGLSLGAICAEGGLQSQRTSHVFWGDAFDDEAIAAALQDRGLQNEKCDAIDESVAGLVADGYLVGRFCGPMEWGPRALGNRSVLARTSDPQVVDRLNTLLQRSEFMPFAPAVLAEEADDFFSDMEAGRYASEFMTACFDATDRMKNEHPAVVHVDGTVRPQLVRREANPGFHRLLSAYRNITGSGLLLNTSFNIHEEPIVRTPAEAISAFIKAQLDYLAIGNYLIPSAQIREQVPAAPSQSNSGS